MSNSKFMRPRQFLRRPPILAKSDGVFDAPQKFQKETIEYLSAVSPKWRCGMIGTDTLAITVPHDQAVLGLSKEKFVDLLEFAEDKLEVSRVLAVFEKSKISPTEGFPRTLRYVGFRALAPENHPEELPSDQYFIMCYRV